MFSEEELQLLYILNYAPNGMWTYLVSTYYLVRRNNGHLEKEPFVKFLHKITAFIFAYAFTNPGVNTLRQPIFIELEKFVRGNDITFSSFKFDERRLTTSIDNFKFSNSRVLTKSLLTWWSFQI